MPETNIKKAMELLKQAHDVLNKSEVENLKKSAEYLEKSILWLNRHGTGDTDRVH